VLTVDLVNVATPDEASRLFAALADGG